MDSKPSNNSNNNTINQNNLNQQIPPIQGFTFNNNSLNNNFNPNTIMPPSFIFNSNNAYNKAFQSGSFITTSLQKLKNGDDMDIMSELINLCDQLSLANELLGSNPNLPKLLEEICKNLDKIYLPEIVIYSLQCINYILDLNPRLANVLRKNNVVPKLITIINTLEDISCLDSIVMVFEKISLNNAILLLENNVFMTLLNIFDFMGKNQRKSIMKCLQNIAINIINYKEFDTYIKPASHLLCNLTQYRENDTDTQILERAINIYYNIIINLKQYGGFENGAILEEELIKYNYFQNFCDILTKYFIERDKKITSDLVKKILQIISTLCEISILVVDKFLTLNLLPLLVEIINYEFEENQISTSNTISSLNNINSDINNNANSTFLTEFFSVLISLFPFNEYKNKDTKEINNIKILSNKNKEYYTYFCTDILKPLVNNIMNKSACSNLINLIKLILIFIKTTEKDNIISHIDSKPMSQIVSKLLDTKYSPYLNDLSILIDILMTKAPEFYIKNFIREGIIETLKNYITEEDIKVDEKIDKNEKEKETIENKDKKDNKEKEKEKEKKDNKSNNDDNKEKKNDDNLKSEETIFKELLEHFKKGGNISNISSKNNNILDNLLMMDEQSFKMKRDEYLNKEKILTKKKVKELFSKYFTPEQIEIYIKNSDKENELTNLKDILSSLEKDLSESCIKNKEDKEKMNQSFRTILDILTNPINEITLFELENSNIIIGLCEFFEPQFKSLYNKLDFSTDSELQKNIDLNNILPSPLIYNENIFERVKILFDNFESKEKLISFIKLLEYSITSMNCFTMIVDDAQNNNLNFYYNQVSFYSKRYNIKVYYNETSYKEKIVNNFLIKDDAFKAKCSEYNYAFKSAKEFKFSLTNNFDELSSYLLSNTNVPFVYNENYEIVFDYFLDLNYKGKKEKFEIKSKWNIKDIKVALIEKYGKPVAESFFGSPIYFGIEFKLKEKDEDNNINNINDNFNIKGYKDNIINSIGDKMVNFDNISKELLNFDKLSFLKDYHNLIIYSKSLYEIKRLMPSLFLLSIIHLALKKYKILFNINKEFFKNDQELDELFINSKVTLLISKACGDAYSVSRSSLPTWCKNLSLDCGFLSKFDSRQLLYKVSFDPKRSLINLQNYLKSINPNYRSENITLEKSMRLKIIVERNKIIEHGLKLIDNPVTSRFNGYLEFEYMGEIGNGLGPTLEFYRLIAEKLYENKELWYKTTDKSMYPALGLNNNKKALRLFKLLGYIVGRVIYDDRLLDFPISRIFWNLLLNKSIRFSDIKIIDKDLYIILNDMIGLINKKKEFLEKNKDKIISDEQLEESILYNGKKLSSVDIYFTFPGYEVELKKDGKNILLTMKNIEEYVNLIYDFLFYRGIYNVTESFKEGFNIIHDINGLKCFTSDELEEVIFGSDNQKWEQETLYENLKPEHGYNKKSKIFNDLIKYMISLDKEEQKKFLIFSTGASRLPVGGFKALSPKLTVVKKTCNGNDNPDNFLPTVMTCQNYLKIPEYSSFEVLKQKFNLAMNEGSNEFHLS